MENNWQTLPWHIVRNIATKLSTSDVLVMREVCKSWKEAIPKQPYGTILDQFYWTLRFTKCMIGNDILSKTCRWTFIRYFVSATRSNLPDKEKKNNSEDHWIQRHIWETRNGFFYQMGDLMSFHDNQVGETQITNTYDDVKLEHLDEIDRFFKDNNFNGRFEQEVRHAAVVRLLLNTAVKYNLIQDVQTMFAGNWQQPLVDID
jgi:hypothetical protein